MSVEIAAVSPFHAFVMEELERRFTVHKLWEETDKIAALRSLADRVRGVASGGMVGLPTAMIEALPKLEICAINGVGLETTDLVTARSKGIVVTTTPVLFDEVADLAVLLAMAACRRLVQADGFVRAGSWSKGRFPPATKFSGKRCGILGLGRIGMALARRLEGFDADIAYYDPFPKAGVAYEAMASAVELAERSDILFMAAAGGSASSGEKVVTLEMLDALGPAGVFVNIARGWLVDEPALVDALVSGRLGAAGLDVFEAEPKVPTELLALDNVVLTPHIASNTRETMQAMGQCVIDNLTSWFEGKGALTPVP